MKVIIKYLSVIFFSGALLLLLISDHRTNNKAFNIKVSTDEVPAAINSLTVQEPQKADRMFENTKKTEEIINVVQPTASPRVAKALDYSSLNSIDSTKKNWGVQLKGKGIVPEVPNSILPIFKKYDAYYLGDTSIKKVYLVFSASYEGGHTGKILDALKQNDVKATFFLVGQYMKDRPQLVKRMLDEGHEVGNHSMNHPCLPLVSNEKLQSEVAGLDQYFYENFGKEMKYFMPPSGEYSEKVLAAAKQMKYTTVFWSFAYLDYDEKDQKGTEYAYNKSSRFQLSNFLIIIKM